MKNQQISKTLLNAWQQDYQLLHDILNSEQLALEKRNFDMLSQSVKEKNNAVVSINNHQIPPFLDNSGVTIINMKTFKTFCQTVPELQLGWNNLMQLVEKCCLKNEVNARLIELLNASSKRTFNLIKGFDPDNNIYNASGGRTSVRYNSASISA